MISLLFLYFIGKAFYTLADNFNKNKWLFAILGAIYVYNGTNEAEELSGFSLSLFCLPLGILTCWIFYIVLKSQWKKADIVDKSNALDSNVF
jgi:hypothetical protein